MGTKIRFKRKESEGIPTNDTDKILTSGEPFYNTANKHLYVGNSDADNLGDKKHIAQVSVQTDAVKDVYSVSIGEDDSNKFEIDGAGFKVEDSKISMDLEDIILDGGGVPNGDTEK